jgi:hypothetical protein
VVIRNKGKLPLYQSEGFFFSNFYEFENLAYLAKIYFGKNTFLQIGNYNNEAIVLESFI